MVHNYAPLCTTRAIAYSEISIDHVHARQLNSAQIIGWARDVKEQPSW